ncbi:MAG: hypothetical protein AAGJ81_03195 [Verrucomicrobiota bacterium]
MKSTSFLLFLSIALSALSLSLDANSSILNNETGIILPKEIAGLKIGEKHVYDEPGLGKSVTYSGDGAYATVYIYNKNRTDLKDDPNHQAIVEELSATLGEIRKVEELGIYENVVFGNSARKSGKDGTFTFLSMPINFDQVLDFDTREPIERRQRVSLVGVGLFDGSYVKLRYSIRKGKNLEEQERIRDEFVNDLVNLVLMVEIRSQVEGWLTEYMADPLSERGREVIGGIVAYAEKSPLIQIYIDPESMPWLEVDNYPYTSELLGAYLAGQVNAQLQTKIFESNEAAGMGQALEVYRLLREKDEAATLDDFEERLSSTPNVAIEPTKDTNE